MPETRTIAHRLAGRFARVHQTLAEATPRNSNIGIGASLGLAVAGLGQLIGCGENPAASPTPFIRMSSPEINSLQTQAQAQFSTDLKINQATRVVDDTVASKPTLYEIGATDERHRLIFPDGKQVVSDVQVVKVETPAGPQLKRGVLIPRPNQDAKGNTIYSFQLVEVVDEAGLKPTGGVFMEIVLKPGVNPFNFTGDVNQQIRENIGSFIIYRPDGKIEIIDAAKTKDTGFLSLFTQTITRALSNFAEPVGAEPLQAPTSAPTAPASPAAKPSATSSVVPSATVELTKTPIPKPEAIAATAAKVYKGPGNLGYDTVDLVPQGTKLTIIGSFGDFFKVQWTGTDGKTQEGYVYSKELGQISNPNLVPKLNEGQVSWQPVKNIGMKGYDNSSSNDWFGKDRAPLKTGDGPFGITINLNSSFGDFPSLSLSGRINSDPNKPWWQDVSRLYIAVQKGRIVMSLRDGRSESSSVNIDLPKLPAGQTFSLVFSDAQGKKFTLVDNSGKAIGEVNVTQYGNFPNGLFPDKKLYPGMLISPKGSLTVNQLSLSTPPSGKYGEAAAEARFTSEFPPLPNVNNINGYYDMFGDDSSMRYEGGWPFGKNYEIWGTRPTISLDDSNHNVVKLTMTINTLTGKTPTYTILASPSHPISFIAPYVIADFDPKAGRVKLAPPGYRGGEPSIFEASDPEEVGEAFNYYVQFLQSKGVNKFHVQLVSKDGEFSPDENGVFKIGFLYPPFTQ